MKKKPVTTTNPAVKTIRQHVFGSHTDTCIHCGISLDDDMIAPEKCILRPVTVPAPMKSKPKCKFYLIPIWKGIEPHDLVGPFDTFQKMAVVAIKEKVSYNLDDGDSFFWLLIKEGQGPMVGSFTNGELDM